MHEGRWQGRQIVPEDWVSRSIKRHVHDIPWGPPGVYGYGFMWYTGTTRGIPAYPIIRAAGNGDQRIFILPKQQLVVTIFAGMYNEGRFASRGILNQILIAYEGN